MLNFDLIWIVAHGSVYHTCGSGSTLQCYLVRTFAKPEKLTHFFHNLYIYPILNRQTKESYFPPSINIVKHGLLTITTVLS